MKINKNIEIEDTKINFGDIACNVITDEILKCGYKVNNKNVYVKRVNLGTLPTSGEKNVNHGLTNFIPIRIEGIAYNSDLSDIIPLPFATPFGQEQNYSVQVSLTNSVIYILTYNNNSDKVGYLDIYFIKKS